MSVPRLSHLQEYVTANSQRLESQYEETMELTQLELDIIEREEEDEQEQQQQQKYKENVLLNQLSDDPEGFYQFTGFSIEAFKILYGYVESELNKPRRGRKTNFTPVDQFILFLHYLRSYPKLESLKAIFHIEPSTLENMIQRNLKIVRPILQDEFIEKQKMKSLLIDSPQDFPDAKFIVDATVQKINKPSIDWNECCSFFSGKHFIYCLKNQVIVNLKGIAVNVVSGVKGAEHDKSIFDRTIDYFKNSLTDQDFKIIGDKGYQEAGSKILLTPVKGNVNLLSRRDLQYNEKLGKIRILVENYFGRLKSKFTITTERFRGSHSIYNDIFVTCCALANFDIIFGHPLRQEDNEFFRKDRALAHRENMRKKDNFLRKKEYLRDQRLKRFKADFLLRSSSSESSED